MLVIPLGLAVLGLEFAWARHWLHRLRETAAAAANHFNRKGDGGVRPARGDARADAAGSGGGPAPTC
jgi:hypothetical protein